MLGKQPQLVQQLGCPAWGPGLTSSGAGHKMFPEQDSSDYLGAKAHSLDDSVGKNASSSSSAI